MEEKRNVPKLRFPGFTDDWEQRKFGEITTLKSASRVHKEEWESEGVPFYRSSDVMSAINGTQNEKAFISEELYEKLSAVSGKLEEGDILVTGGGSVGNPYIVPNNDPLYTKDADLLWIKNQGRFDAYFVYAFFFSPTFRNYIRSISHVGTIAHYTISQLSETPISLPTLDEQKQIGNYFRSFDNLITLHQSKLDSMKEYKKGLLQKMFPKKGETVPEIRFPGFTDDWEQRKFGDVGSVSMCKRIFKDETSDEGDIPFYKIGTFGDTPDAYISRELFEEYKNKFSYPNEGDILLSASGTIGRIVEYDGEEAYFQDSNIVWLNHDKTISNNFLKVLYPTVKWDGIEGSTLQRLYNDNFLKTRFMMPSLPEQERIGDYFEQLDNLITLHQRKLDAMKEYKKGLLQQMFV